MKNQVMDRIAAGCSGDSSSCVGQCAEKGCSRGTNEGEVIRDFPLRVLRLHGSERAIRNRIEALDLSMVKMKLCEPAPEGKGWTEKRADEIEEAYKTFLFMTATISAHPVVPTLEVDAMWHQHILDTRSYMKDCDRTFGEYLHHFPYFGLRGEKDAENLQAAFRRTQEALFVQGKVAGCALCSKCSVCTVEAVAA